MPTKPDVTETMADHAPDPGARVDDPALRAHLRAALDERLRDEWADELCTTTTIKLSLLDRLRVLVTGTVHHRLRVGTSVRIPRHRVTESAAWAARLRPPKGLSMACPDSERDDE